MLKNLILIFLTLGCLSACAKVSDAVDQATYVSKQKEIAAQMLYRGLMYGKLEQFKPYVTDDLYQYIASDKKHFESLENIIPKRR